MIALRAAPMDAAGMDPTPTATSFCGDGIVVPPEVCEPSVGRCGLLQTCALCLACS